jgi:2-polyprenyl-3-methyl-5-hydroxy-6-metoxy-1,4-benzoquinol methylase
MGNAARNEQHYDKAYSSNSLIKALAKLFLSYDQLSKTRRNIAAVENHLKSSTGLSVLDYGFGHGTFLYRVPRTHAVTGCELSSEAMRNLKRLFAIAKRPVTLLSQKEFQLASHEMKYDLICCSHVLEHVDNDIELLDAFHDHLRDNGSLLINVPINEVWKDPKHVREYTPAYIDQQLLSAGFIVESLSEADRWTAYILHNEYVSKSLPRLVFKALRLFLAPLPVALLDRMERLLPERYRFQQLIVVAKKT